MRRYRDFLAQEYLPRARATIGVSSNPYGEECYRASIRATTGLELSADSIHRLGLATVADLEDAMRRIAERSFGTSDVATLLHRLRSDPGSSFGARERSEEHTSELQSQSNLVCRLLLEKKKKKKD